MTCLLSRPRISITKNYRPYRHPSPPLAPRHQKAVICSHPVLMSHSFVTAAKQRSFDADENALFARPITYLAARCRTYTGDMESANKFFSNGYLQVDTMQTLNIDKEKLVPDAAHVVQTGSCYAALYVVSGSLRVFLIAKPFIDFEGVDNPIVLKEGDVAVFRGDKGLLIANNTDYDFENAVEGQFPNKRRGKTPDIDVLLYHLKPGGNRVFYF